MTCSINVFFFFDRPMMRSFFTASQLFTILKQFGELSEEVSEHSQLSLCFKTLSLTDGGEDEICQVESCRD